MAVVVKCKNDVEEIAEEKKSNASIFKKNNNPNSKQRKADVKGRITWNINFFIFIILSSMYDWHVQVYVIVLARMNN